MRKGIYYMWCLLCLLSGVKSETKVVYPSDPLCHKPLGLESGVIRDKRITTPPNTVSSGKEGYNVRLNNEAAWCIKSDFLSVFLEPIFLDDTYVEITLPAVSQITAIALQGGEQFGYGDYIRLTYFSGVFLTYNNFNREKDLHVKNLVGEQYEYLELNPTITTNKLRICLQTSFDIRCLRAELYGCMDKQRLLKYKECNQQEILKSKNIENITQSNFTKLTSLDYDGKKVLISEPYTWCVKKDSVPIDRYGDWVQFKMNANYLLYGIRVNSYQEVVSNNLVAEIKLQYSLDANDGWASYKGGMSIQTANYRSSYLKFEPPLVAKLIRVSIRNNGTDNVCLKMQFSGCSGVHFGAQITQYKIFQGIEYFDSTYGLLKWLDIKYDGQLNSDEELIGGKGCLIDGSNGSTSTPFEDPNCWIGWKKSNISSPYILLQMSRPAAFTGLVVRTYVDENIGASAIKRFRVDYSPFRSFPSTLGYTCAPTNVYHISPRIVDFHLDLNGITAQYINLKFEYSGEWILIRQVTLNQDSIAGEDYLKMSASAPVCLVLEKEELPTEEARSGSNKVLLIVSVVLAMCLLLVLAFLLYHYRTSLHNIFKARTGTSIIESAHLHNNDRDDGDVYAEPEPVVSFGSNLNPDDPEYAQVPDLPTAQSMSLSLVQSPLLATDFSLDSRNKKQFSSHDQVGLSSFVLRKFSGDDFLLKAKSNSSYEHPCLGPVDSPKADSHNRDSIGCISTNQKAMYEVSPEEAFQSDDDSLNPINEDDSQDVFYDEDGKNMEVERYQSLTSFDPNKYTVYIKE